MLTQIESYTCLAAAFVVLFSNIWWMVQKKSKLAVQIRIPCVFGLLLCGKYAMIMPKLFNDLGELNVNGIGDHLFVFGVATMLVTLSSTAERHLKAEGMSGSTNERTENQKS